MYSTKETLFTHINNVHKEGVTRPCPFCDEKVYTSEGGYYKHMCVKHKISRNTIKLIDYMKAQGTEDNNLQEDENVEKDDSDSDKKKQKRKSKKKKKTKMRNQKIVTMVQRRQMEEGEKMSDQKILMTWSPGIREERQRQMMLARSQKILKMTNSQRSRRIQKEKEMLEGHLNLSKLMWKWIQKEILTRQKEQDQVDL